MTQGSLLFGGAGTKPATEAEFQEFGESVRARPDEVEGRSLALRRTDVEIEEVEGNLAPDKYKTTEVENNPILQSCEDEPRRAPGARPTMMGCAGPASADPQ